MSPQRRTIGRLFIIPIVMFGFGYLMVPIYDVFCDITGINGKTGSISESVASTLEVQQQRTIRVEFTSTVNQEGPWEFKPDVASMLVHPGQVYTTSYTARNKEDVELISQSVPSVAPSKAAAHFNKTECFCFTEQKFEALEQRAMPVTFIIDPEVPEDVDTVTLSYTLFTKGDNNNG